MAWIEKKYRLTKYFLDNYGTQMMRKRGTRQVYKGRYDTNDPVSVFIQRTPTSKNTNFYVNTRANEPKIVEVTSKPTVIISL